MRADARGAAGREGSPSRTAGEIQRATIVAEVEDAGKQGCANLRTLNVDAICDLMNVSRRSFFLAKRLCNIGCPELVAEVVAGRMSLHLARQIARATHDGQRLILTAIEGCRPRERTQMVRWILTEAEREAQR